MHNHRLFLGFRYGYGPGQLYGDCLTQLSTSSEGAPSLFNLRHQVGLGPIIFWGCGPGAFFQSQASRATQGSSRVGS